MKKISLYVALFPLEMTQYIFRCSTSLSTKLLVVLVLDSQLWEARIVLGEPLVSLSGGWLVLPRQITSSPPSSGQCFLEVKQRWRRHQGSKKVPSGGRGGGGGGGGAEKKKTQDGSRRIFLQFPSSLSVLHFSLSLLSLPLFSQTFVRASSSFHHRHIQIAKLPTSNHILKIALK